MMHLSYMQLFFTYNSWKNDILIFHCMQLLFTYTSWKNDISVFIFSWSNTIRCSVSKSEKSTKNKLWNTRMLGFRSIIIEYCTHSLLYRLYLWLHFIFKKCLFLIFSLKEKIWQDQEDQGVPLFLYIIVTAISTLLISLALTIVVKYLKKRISDRCSNDSFNASNR